MKCGLFIGRFQPYHLGHLHIIKEALKEVNKLFIGIGCAQEQNTKENPFSAKERKEMIDLTLKKNKIKNCFIYEIPDFKYDNDWIKYIERKIPKFEIVFMSNKNTYGEKWVEKCFKNKYRIKKIKALKNIDATLIRKRILKNQEWQGLVPKEVSEYIINNLNAL